MNLTESQIEQTILDLKARAERLDREIAERTAELSAANHELRVEAALERVRGRAMAMRSSDELAELSLQLVQQVQSLDVDTWFCAFNIYDDDPRGSIEWGSDGRGTIPHYRTPREGIFLRYYEAGRRGEELLINEIGEDECPAHYEWLCTLPGVGDVLLDMKASGIDFPASQIDHVAYNRYGYIIFITFDPVPDAYDIFMRFSKVFEQTYTRFLDLQKAEAQTRDAEINLAVEKVRARAMAMRESTEIVDVAGALRAEMTGLGVGDVAACTIFVARGGNRYRVAEVAHPGGEAGKQFTFDIAFDLADLPDDFHAHEILRVEDYHVIHMDRRRVRGAMEVVERYDPEYAAGWQSWVESDEFTDLWTSVYPLDVGKLCIDFSEHPDAEVAWILPKMASAFDLAWKRFTDLQQAEAQTREAEINLAVEKVRARAMAMHRSEEMSDVAITLRNELQGLGVSGVSSSTVYTEQGNGRYRIWDMAEIQDVDESLITLDFIFHPGDAKGDLYFNDILSAGGYSTFHYHGDRLRSIANWLAEYDPVSADRMHRLLDDGDLPDLWISSYPVERGFLSVDTVEPPSDELESILPKMAEAFDLAYRRFEDLLRAEAQTREAQIDAALERVRSHAVSMTTSDELLEVVLTIHRQFAGLGLPCEVFWHAKYLPDHYEKALTGVGGQRVTTIMELPKDFSAVPELAAWERGTEKLGVFKFDADAAAEYLNHMISKGKFLEVDPNAITEDMVRDNHGWTFVQARTTHGELGYNLWGETDPSEEARAVLLRFARVFDLAYRRFEDLRESEAAAREARIEAALERVRARTMGMQKSFELQDVARTYADQLEDLGMDIHGAMFLLQDPEDEAWTLWTGYSRKYPLNHVRGKTFEFPFQEVEGDPSIDAWRRGETVKESFISPDELPEWTEKFRIILDASGQTPDDWIRLNPDGYFRIDAYMKYGVVAGGGARAFTDEEVQIQVRFAREFERTYRRFLDLKKAEEQAYESRTEAALERLRSRTMGMQSSDELLDVAGVMTEQLVELGLDIHWAYLYLYNEEQDELEVYLAKSSTHPVPQAKGGSGLWKYPRYYHDPGQGQAEFIEAWSKRDAFRTVDFGKDRFDEWADQFQMMFDDLGYSREDYRPHAPDGIFNVEALMGPGYVGMGGARPFDQADIDVLVRFAKEFEGTYRRFLDIARAEAQSRESQIESALERVRSRSMAMHHSDEMSEVMACVFTEMTNLGVTQAGDRAFIADIVSDDPPSARVWLTSKGGKEMDGSFVIPDMNAHEGFRAMYDAVSEGVEYYSVRYEGEKLRSLSEAHAAIPGFVDLVSDSISAQNHENLPEGLTWIHAPFSKGDLGLVIERPDLAPESRAICVRFSKVFDQSYRRFLDLQDSERRAVEVRKQASVDRIRAEIATMRTTDDFDRITPLIWQELETQQIPFIRCGLLIVSEAERLTRFYLSRPDGRSLAALELPFGSTEVADSILASWHDGQMWFEIWDSERFVRWTRELLEAGQIDKPEAYYGGEDPPESVALHFAPFEQGMMYVGATESLDAEGLEIVQALADAFSVAYARYDDFRTTERALTDLRATQKQLIEQEKLASLGSLTAGIAHEIKNPLNFVNNFAEVSEELLDELAAAVSAGDADEAAALLDELRQNARQIAKHGGRADSIVRSMMQHARGGASERETIDVNAFVDEYVDLAWHGMRARDHTFQCDVERTLDPDAGAIEGQPQELGRVLLNVLNNAFYAIGMDGAAAELSVRVTTSREDGRVHITVEDSGPGIPGDIREKIFEPFFTTKPTGEGTGLGLSLSYDIVTKGHGGEMTVENTPAGGASFVVSVPAR